MEQKKKERVEKWIENFNKEIKGVEIEFQSFFLKATIHDYYKIHVDEQIGFISIELLHREQLPTEIIDSLTVAFLRAKPLS